MKNDQQQHVGEGATAIQGAGDVSVVIQQGLGYADVKQIALEVFRANLMEMKGRAVEKARIRGEEITERFVRRLESEHPAGLQQAEEPDFQDAVFSVQKEYAKAGDEELGDLLVNLLVDRTKESSRNLIQLVLNESLRVAPKLTNDQLALLSLVFLLRHVNANPNTVESLVAFLKINLEPLIAGAQNGVSSVSYLGYTGCGIHSSLSGMGLEAVILGEYRGLLGKGIDAERVNAIVPPNLLGLFRPGTNDATKLELAVPNETVLKKVLDAAAVEPEMRVQLQNLFAENPLAAPEVRTWVIEKAPFMDAVFNLWVDDVKRFTLTSVGMAIAHANIRRVTGQAFAPLSIWVK
ncbi:MAG: hypothetical protein Q7T13_09595 [Polaromonas sp.]|nr:hypothetical protein [Polaromonas sp.]